MILMISQALVILNSTQALQYYQVSKYSEVYEFDQAAQESQATGHTKDTRPYSVFTLK